MAGGGDLASPPAAPLLLASTSPRRREILELLRIPFDVVAPDYEETEDDPVAHARRQGALGARGGRGRPVLGCDTEVVLDGRVYGKPASAERGGGDARVASPAGRTRSSPASLS